MWPRRFSRNRTSRTRCSRAISRTGLRRKFLLESLCLAAISGAAAAPSPWRYVLEDGLWNPCRSPLPARLARHELVTASWDGLQGAEVWDSHAHLVGNGDSGAGIKLNPRMESLLSPGMYTRRAFFMNAGCVREDAVDRSYVERLRQLLEGMHPGSKLLLFAFEQSYDAQGRATPADTTMHVPDACARDVARANPQYFEWV